MDGWETSASRANASEMVGERGFPTYFRPLLNKRRKQPFPRFRAKRVAQSVAQFVAQRDM